ncbi:probable transporter Mch1p [Trichomonascus vanleenenianus]|uniref:Mch1p n=1 Tax=Trichomonascus vanleenenianus TaxID=2268995 RepID=UPI003ECB4EBD
MEKKTRDAVAFFLCVISCLSAGSIGLFSLYTPSLQHQLGYSQYQINAIATAAELGTYLPVPLLGYLGDKYGPHLYAVVASVCLAPTYMVAAYVYNTQGSHQMMAACWALIGMGSSGLFFCCLVSCARLYPNSPGLAISAPTASMGISVLWLAQFIRSVFQQKEGKALDVGAVYTFLAGLYVAGTACGYIASKMAHIEPVDDDEEATDPAADAADAAATAADGEDTPLINKDREEEHEHVTHLERLMRFLKSPQVWIFFMCFLLTVGPLEMYINNMGSIMDTIHGGPDVASHVALFSLASTVARLVAGALSDVVRPYVSRPMQLASMWFVTGLCHFLLSMGALSRNSGHFFYVSSIINGLSYGVTFTITPTIVACVWGVRNIGTNWGVFIVAPAIGSIVYNALFASFYEHASVGTDGIPAKWCTREYLCYSDTFKLTGVGFIGAALTTLWLKNHFWRRNKAL